MSWPLQSGLWSHWELGLILLDEKAISWLQDCGDELAKVKSVTPLWAFSFARSVLRLTAFLSTAQPQIFNPGSAAQDLLTL